MFNRRPFLASVAGALAYATRLALAAAPPVAPPIVAVREPKVKLGGWRTPMSDRRQRFIDAHNRNPLNFLPGRHVHELYGRQASTKEAEVRLFYLMARGYKPKPGYVQQYFDHPAPF